MSGTKTPHLPGQRGPEVGRGGAPPHAAVHRGVHLAHALLLEPVEVLAERVAWARARDTSPRTTPAACAVTCLLPRLQPRLVQLAASLVAGDVQGPAVAAVLIPATAVGLRQPEVRGWDT